MWRCSRRLSNADMPYTTNHPILLPIHHHLQKKMLALEAHSRVSHNGDPSSRKFKILDTQGVKCQHAIHNKTPHSPTNTPPSAKKDVSAQGTLKSFSQWRPSRKFKILGTQGEIVSEMDSPQVPCVQEKILLCSSNTSASSLNFESQEALHSPLLELISLGPCT